MLFGILASLVNVPNGTFKHVKSVKEIESQFKFFFIDSTFKICAKSTIKLFHL